jgi:hypothetical protein
MENIMSTDNKHNPLEVNPWKKHVIENEPTHSNPEEKPVGDVPMEHEKPAHDSTESLGRA